MKTLKFLMIAFFSLLIVFTGCKKDDEGDPSEAPEFKTRTIEVPPTMQNSDDIGAQQATAYIGLANGYANMGAMMTPPGKSTLVTNLKDGTPWTYTWEVSDAAGTFSVTLTVREDSQMYIWEFKITGNIDGINVNDFVYMRGTEYKDGSQGSLEMWDLENGDLLFSWSWTDSDGVFTLELLFPDSFKMLMTVYPDGSGTMDYYTWINQWVLEFRVSWTAAGTGEWWQYQNGAVVEQGFWP